MKEEETKISDLKSNERRDVTGLEKGREGGGGWGHEHPLPEGKDASKESSQDDRWRNEDQCFPFCEIGTFFLTLSMLLFKSTKPQLY